LVIFYQPIEMSGSYLPAPSLYRYKSDIMPPAARITDMHVCPMFTGPVPHVGGPILPPCSVNVMIGYLPAARVGDMATCAGPPDVIVKGSPTVFINGRPAARMLDTTAHGGTIVMGCFTVIIGDGGGGAGGGGGLSTPAAGSAPATRNKGSGGKGGGISGSSGSSKEPKRDGFKSSDAAAKAALKEANPKSIKANKEYGGLIYKKADGTYGYTKPAAGTGDSFNPHKISTPPGTTVVGDYHTHGDYSVEGKDGNPVRTSNPKKDDYNSDNFSDDDILGITDDAKGKSEYRGYLGTPSGTFKVFDPATGSIKNL
jgi:uncharacterized Zn-binding protein involved in type VI secretion